MKPRKTPIFIEFKERSVHVLDGDDGLDLPLERDGDGRISSASLPLLENGLRGFLQRHGTHPQAPAICSIPARGVIVRRVSLPAAAKGDLNQLLMLQLEAQLPVSPNDLSCFFSRLDAGSETIQEFVVAAVRKDILKHYSALLLQLGFYPPAFTAEFSVAALARAALLDESIRPCAILEIGKNKSELSVLDARGPASLRVLPWGSENSSDLEKLYALLQNSLGQKLYLSGEGSLDQIASALAPKFEAPALCEVLLLPPGAGRTSANLGAKSSIEKNTRLSVLAAQQSQPIRKSETAATWKWAVAACLLLLLSLSLRYAEAAIYKSRVSRKFDQITHYKATLPKIERELSFLNFIKTNQPAYLDAMAVVANAAPSGTRIDTLTVVRRGDLSMSGSMMGDPQGPANFRSKLVDSGFFLRVVVEEQTPLENGQKMNFRMTAQLKPEATHKPFTPTEPAKALITNQPGTNRPARAPMPPPQITQN